MTLMNLMDRLNTGFYQIQIAKRQQQGDSSVII